MRNRASVVIIEKNKVALIKRVRGNLVYYVFPGGGIEKGESPEEAAKREALEELGVKAEIKRCIAKVKFNGIQYFFLAEFSEGTFGSGQGKEYTDVYRNRGTYEPVWLPITQLKLKDVRPAEVVEIIDRLFRLEK